MWQSVRGASKGCPAFPGVPKSLLMCPRSKNHFYRGAKGLSAFSHRCWPLHCWCESDVGWNLVSVFLRGLLGSGAWLQEWTLNLPSYSQWKEKPGSLQAEKQYMLWPILNLTLLYLWDSLCDQLVIMGQYFFSTARQHGWWIHGKMLATFSTQMEQSRFVVRDQPWLHSTFKASLGYMRICLQN